MEDKLETVTLRDAEWKALCKNFGETGDLSEVIQTIMNKRLEETDAN